MSAVLYHSNMKVVAYSYRSSVLVGYGFSQRVKKTFLSFKVYEILSTMYAIWLYLHQSQGQNSFSDHATTTATIVPRNAMKMILWA